MSELVYINVGGTMFMTKLSLLRKHSDTLLGSLTTTSEYYIKEKDYYFFDRNPEFFNTILDYYRNGQIHFPNYICGSVWKQEIEFWRIPASEISECCFPTYIKYNRDLEVTNKIKEAFYVQTFDTQKSSGCGGLRQNIWLFLDEPTSSKLARIYSFIYLFIVLLSTVVTMVITYPDIRNKVYNIEEIVYYFEQIDLPLWINVDNPKEIMFLTTLHPRWLQDIDRAITVFFSIEIIMRLIFCPSKLKFVKSFMNILDLVLFVAMWSRFIIEIYGEDSFRNINLFRFHSICHSLVAFRLLRFFRITKQYSALRILILTVRESLKELGLLCITFLVFVLLFANIIYFAEFEEPSTFPDMLIGLWWAVVTMTTVGYGDVVPKSALGRIVGSMCAISGLLLLAMPIAVIAGKFNNLYDKNADREDYKKLRNFNKEGSSRSNMVTPLKVKLKKMTLTVNETITETGIKSEDRMDEDKDKFGQNNRIRY